MTPDDERLRRWRLVLGEDEGVNRPLTGDDLARDAALAQLYGGQGDGSGDGGDGSGSGSSRGGRASRSAGLGGSAPRVARWLGDVRRQFPPGVVRVMQRDAIDRLGIRKLLLEPELLEAVTPDVHLAATLISLADVVPERSRATARALVRAVTAELEQRLAQRTRAAVTGALDRSARTQRPRRLADVDWDRTIRANLKHYVPDKKTVVPERLIGHGRRERAVQRDVILCLDQSGSMAASVIYASVFGAVLASLRAVRTRLVVFDTSVVDLTDELGDPVDLLFGVQLGGGTDINRALAYCADLIQRPNDTILVLVSDLIEGGVREEMLKRAAALAASGVTVVALLALSDEGAPAYDHDNAAALGALGIPAFACSPDQFPDLMAAAIERRDVFAWAADNGLAVERPAGA